MNANPRRDDRTDDEQPLDASDLSEGDVVELEFQNYGNARYEVEGEWTDDADDPEDYENPSDDMTGMFPGLKATRVWTEDAGDYRDLPHRRATLVLDADSHTGGLVDNYPDDETEGYEVLSVQRAEKLSVEDRWTVEGDMTSATEKHVARVVREAIEEDPLVGTIRAESVTLKDSDHSGTGVLGNDLGPVVSVAEALDLHVREAFEEFLFENLNENHAFECERTSVWSFYRK